jgi:xanthine/uracil permease
VVATSVGGSPTTTYAENIGVMAATRIYSTAAYYVAGAIAILFGLVPKFGELVNMVPIGAGIILAIGPVDHHVGGGFTLSGIAFGTLVVLIGYHLLRALAPPYQRVGLDPPANTAESHAVLGARTPISKRKR